MAEDTKTYPAAYLPFKTFLSSVETLGQGLPRKLDRTVWRSQSGIVQSQIMSAFHFLGLLDDDDRPTKLLQSLVEQSDQRPSLVGEMLHGAYIDVLAHDLTKTTPKMLEELMEQYNVQGDTKRKAIAFFLRAAKYAEIPMNHLLSAGMRNTSNAVRKKRKATAAATTTANGQQTPAAESSQVVSKTVLLPSGTAITLHIQANWIDMVQTERDYVFGLIDYLRQYTTAVGEDDDDEEDAP